MDSTSQPYAGTPAATGQGSGDKTDVNPSDGRCKSPDQCSICLGQFRDKSFTDSCFHTFCFPCLQEWAKVKPVCPLCKTPFNSVIHNIKSNEDYERFYLPAPAPPNQAGGDDPERRFRYATTLTRDRQYLLEARRMRQFARDARREERRRREENALSRRRLIYQAGLRVLHMGSNLHTGFRDISPQFFRANPAVTHRLVPWLRRDLSVLFDNQEEHVTFMTHYILSLITNVDIQSEEFHVNLRPFLHDSTEHFVHEFANFARSPYDMDAYDQMAQYDFSGEGASQPHMRMNLPVRPPPQGNSDSDEHSVVLLSDHDSEPMMISDDNASDQELETIQTGNPARPPVVGLLSEPTSPPASGSFPSVDIASPNSSNLGLPTQSHVPAPHLPGSLPNHPQPPPEAVLPPSEPVLPPPPPESPPALPALPQATSAPPPEPPVAPPAEPAVASSSSIVPQPKPAEPSVDPNQPGPSGLQTATTAEPVKIKEEPPDFHDSDHSDIEFVAFLKPAHMRTPERFMLSSESESEVKALEEDRKKWQKEKKRRKRLREMMQEINTIEQNMITVDSDSGGRRSRSRSSSYDRSPSRRRRSRSRDRRRRRSRSVSVHISRSKSKDREGGRRSTSNSKTASWRDKFGYGGKSPPRAYTGSSRKQESRKEDREYQREKEGVRENSSRDRREKSISRSRKTTSHQDKTKSVDKRRKSPSRSQERRVRRSRSHSHEKRAKASRSRSRERKSKSSKGDSRDRRSKPSRSRSPDRRDKSARSHSRERKNEASLKQKRVKKAKPTRSRSRDSHIDERAAKASRSCSRDRRSKPSRSRSHSRGMKPKPSRSRSRDRGARSSRSRSHSHDRKAKSSHSHSHDKSAKLKGKTKSHKKRSRSPEKTYTSRQKESRKSRERSHSKEKSTTKHKKSKKHSKKRSRSRSESRERRR